MKAQRQAAIIAAVRAERIESQDQLRRLLRGQGIAVTQATLSRDIRELGLAKVPDPDGGSYYSAPPAPEAVQPRLAQLVGALLLSVEGVGPLIVVRTPAGSANTVARAVDQEAWPDVLGTLAGDDTILIITRSERARRTVAGRLTDALAAGA